MNNLEVNNLSNTRVHVRDKTQAPYIEYIRPRKKFVSCNVLKENRVGRSVKKKFLIIFLVRNMCFMHVLLRFGVGRTKNL